MAPFCSPLIFPPRYGYGEFFQDDDEVPDDAAFDQVPLETVNVATGGSLRKRAKSNAGSPPKPKDDYESDREKNIERTKMKYSDFDKYVTIRHISHFWLITVLGMCYQSTFLTTTRATSAWKHN